MFTLNQFQRLGGVPSWRLRGSTFREELYGGLVSAAVAIPLAMGFGMFAFVSLGDKYFAYGALAGLCTAFVVGVASVMLGDRTTTVYAPRINSTFFLGALLFGLVHSDGVLGSASIATILAVFFLVILLGALFQALFGMIRVGTLIKYTPHPVVAGFQDTAAALLFLVQSANVAGYDETRSFAFVLMHPGDAKLLSLLVAGITFMVMWNARKIVSKVPPLLVGLAAGTVLYYALIAVGLGEHLGPVIGETAEHVLRPTPWASLGDKTQIATLLSVWPTWLGGGLALAIIASIDALLCAKLVRHAGDGKVDADRLLGRLGLSNIAAGCFGGITSGINIGASLTNQAFGGRTPLSVLINAAAILLAFTVAFPIMALLPRAVLSAVIMVVAAQHFDPWSMRLIGGIRTSSGARQRHLMLELAVVVIVAVLSITLNIVLAVFIGVLIAVMLFVARMSRSIIRRSYRCGGISSRKSRNETEMHALEHHGGLILVMELQGALFFGTGERLLEAIATAAAEQNTQFLILDLRRLSEVDSTGGRILLDIQANLMRQEMRLALALHQGSDIAARLRDFGVLEQIPQAQIFEDVDRAMQWAEDNVLSVRLQEPGSTREMSLEQVGILQELAPDEMSLLKKHLRRVTYNKGEPIFQQGDVGDELFIVTKGTASAHLHQPGIGDIRLVTFAPGTVFGELAILDASPRSAAMLADEDLVAYTLSRVDFAGLSSEAPSVAIKLLGKLGYELSGRLRRANRTLLELEI